MEPKTHTIDATGKKLGRVASEAAHLLMEKDSPSFEKHRKLGTRVTVINANKLSVTEKRANEKNRYKRASGYDGNLIIESIADLRAKHGMKEVVKRAIRGMLPNNKLRTDMLKRLIVTE
jgi:large subunit ribosomal protein L13